MDYKIIKPIVPLRPFVKCFWGLKSRGARKGCSPQRIFPHGSVELTFCFGDGFNLISKNGTTVQPNSYFSGQRTGFMDLSPKGMVEIISVLFFPHAASMFFKMPISELSDHSLTPDDMNDRAFIRLEAQINLACGMDERVRLIEGFLLERLDEAKLFNYNRIDAVVNRLNEVRGQVTVEHLADVACLSKRQLDRLFKSVVGINPKLFLRIVRLHSAIDWASKGSLDNLTQLALRCGFYDQAHFSNDFKVLTGLSPQNFFKQESFFSDYFM